MFATSFIHRQPHAMFALLASVFLATTMAAAADSVDVAESAAAAVPKPLIFYTSSGKFAVVDGDSVRYGKHHFRLCGINAPEKNHRLYQYTTQMLKGLLGRRNKIRAYVVDIDKYGRSVAVMYVRNAAISVNEKMVQQGGARHFKRYSASCNALIKRQSFFAAELHAKKYKRGIWR